MRDVLTKIQITDAEFNDRAIKEYPVKGQIKQRYFVSEDKIITPEMIDQIADKNVKIEDQNKIDILTLCAPVNMTLGS